MHEHRNQINETHCAFYVPFYVLLVCPISPLHQFCTFLFGLVVNKRGYCLEIVQRSSLLLLLACQSSTSGATSLQLRMIFCSQMIASARSCRLRHAYHCIQLFFTGPDIVFYCNVVTISFFTNCLTLQVSYLVKVSKFVVDTSPYTFYRRSPPVSLST